MNEFQRVGHNAVFVVFFGNNVKLRLDDWMRNRGFQEPEEKFLNLRF